MSIFREKIGESSKKDQEAIKTPEQIKKEKGIEHYKEFIERRQVAQIIDEGEKNAFVIQKGLLPLGEKGIKDIRNSARFFVKSPEGREFEIEIFRPKMQEGALKAGESIKEQNATITVLEGVKGMGEKLEDDWTRGQAMVNYKKGKRMSSEFIGKTSKTPTGKFEYNLDFKEEGGEKWQINDEGEVESLAKGLELLDYAAKNASDFEILDRQNVISEEEIEEEITKSESREVKLEKEERIKSARKIIMKKMRKMKELEKEEEELKEIEEMLREKSPTEIQMEKVAKVERKEAEVKALRKKVEEEIEKNYR